MIIGGAAGFVARQILGGQSPGGLLGDLVLGILGALVGGYGLSLLGIAGNGGLIATFIVALVGALFLIWVAHQERTRQAFAEQHRVEQERFAAYQRTRLEQFMKSQDRERGVFKNHQEARFRTWQYDLRRSYAPQAMPAPPMRPGMLPTAAALVAQALTA